MATNWTLSGPDYETSGTVDNDTGDINLELPENDSDYDKDYTLRVVDSDDPSCEGTMTITVKGCGGGECNCDDITLSWDEITFKPNTISFDVPLKDSDCVESVRCNGDKIFKDYFVATSTFKDSGYWNVEITIIYYFYFFFIR